MLILDAPVPVRQAEESRPEQHTETIGQPFAHKIDSGFVAVPHVSAHLRNSCVAMGLVTHDVNRPPKCSLNPCKVNATTVTKALPLYRSSSNGITVCSRAGSTS